MTDVSSPTCVPGETAADPSKRSMTSSDFWFLLRGPHRAENTGSLAMDPKRRDSRFLKGDAMQTSTFSLRTRRGLSECVQSRSWEILMSVIIFANIVFITVAVDNNWQGGPYERIEFMIFLPIFSLEILFRAAVQGRAYFRDGWNWCDIVFTGLMWADLALHLTQPRELPPLLATVQGFRMVRILRFFRLFKNDANMRTFMEGVLKVLCSMLWSLTFLFGLMFVGGVICKQIFMDCLQNCAGVEGVADSDACIGMPENECEDIDIHFGSVLKSMFTLFQIVTLDGWASEVARPAENAVPYSQLFFVIFVIVAPFGMLNILVAGVCQATADVVRAREEQKKEEVKKQRERKMIERLLTDNGSRWTVTKEEALEVLSREIFQLTLERFGFSRRAMAKLPVMVEALFSRSGADSLDALEVIDCVSAAMNESKGPRREVDLIDLYMEVECLSRSVSVIQKGMLGTCESRPLPQEKRTGANAKRSNSLLSLHSMAFADTAAADLARSSGSSAPSCRAQKWWGDGGKQPGGTEGSDNAGDQQRTGREADPVVGGSLRGGLSHELIRGRTGPRPPGGSSAADADASSKGFETRLADHASDEVLYPNGARLRGSAFPGPGSPRSKEREGVEVGAQRAGFREETRGPWGSTEALLSEEEVAKELSFEELQEEEDQGGK
uniref:Ion transport domain-containing protein n=1 Tax=Chromera velia CCMP2878 TaxID=1169474 RepID=A0A0G4HY82_9ALVE|eukprot:Cvel_9428.t1-p1 / transcript=Cvel_9428.t1 / gene=Cvel_9428 / organism=Chromera_velia_CCMP2878 / gene_product=Voltage-dependent L-type calcium channel subunit, putative / transcript_product=Voltage-dependent L-type calcium channel subunit, putative / location=Cvel_scaffold543:43197-45603(+) / protein_length=668 / sequence_SO=supercontig / SO=protein_coding / is_pseudo=false